MLGDGRQLCVIGEFVVVENGQTVAQGLVDGQTVAFGQRRGDEAAAIEYNQQLAQALQNKLNMNMSYPNQNSMPADIQSILLASKHLTSTLNGLAYLQNASNMAQTIKNYKLNPALLQMNIENSQINSLMSRNAEFLLNNKATSASFQDNLFVPPNSAAQNMAQQLLANPNYLNAVNNQSNASSNPADNMPLKLRFKMLQLKTGEVI